jgi:hypothetical protein
LKKERLIVLKDPRLRRIRLALRKILLDEINKRISDLRDKEREILAAKDDYDGTYQGISNEERMIIEQRQKLGKMLSASIVICAMCLKVF